MDSALYNDYSSWIRQRFPFRVQKISVDAGFTCPNRNGSIGSGGCIYCDNRTFNPAYCDAGKGITEQIEEGKRFFAGKYPEMKYMAYFQAFTNTYAPLDKLKRMYEEALACDGIVGLVIGTRPDCVSDELLDYLAELNRNIMVTVEYGVETTNDKTLEFINRGHDFECSKKAIEQTAERGITTGAHIILGLPGEDAEESIRQADIISELSVNILKIHQMQIIKGTKLERIYKEKPFHLYTVDEYITLVTEYIRRLRKDIIIERFVSQSPKNLLIAPHWGLKNYEFTNLLSNHLRKTGARQGDKKHG
ncbi:TIGR01212 family radical SAM protein [Xylanibacter muris]|uniref:TIGR01212 family radical SAM protein n=1 Tax=Xylanibacter muris TaxID=2736290 RepID=A0ABX2AJL8_9BACT|nr:TIGR01212 family radical SAM protein [Xylanibacter muris]NPD91354.1 TIGR01212 family radical SAM protein [Xylanibacter muris]